MIKNKTLKQTFSDEKDYINTCLSLINAVIPVSNRLTKKEKEVLISFLTLPMHKDLIFETTGRNIVKEHHKLSNANMTNYIKSFSSKGFIIKLSNKHFLNKKLLSFGEKTTEFNFKLNYEKQPNS